MSKFNRFSTDDLEILAESLLRQVDQLTQEKIHLRECNCRLKSQISDLRDQLPKYPDYMTSGIQINDNGDELIFLDDEPDKAPF
ncbi:MAG TPA: hypothetical protein DF712_23215 [Balneola sp.]|nr:hypothetical protein [Balneola sp.]|tara:strand:- start:242 stop:493 length:252 start_codon:yes stop_codon:yes gene_type:complete